MPLDQKTGKRLGFAFVNFSCAEAVEKALTLNNSNLNGNKIKVVVSNDQRNFMRE